ncbi:histidine kinase [Anaeromyxobacter sp. Fw109-5]|nr:histidine kinase [Anaeromyxobacter sp. Fw109-5]
MTLSSCNPLDGPFARPVRPREDGDGDAPRRDDGERTSTLGRLLTGDAWVAPDTCVELVAQRFFASPELEAVALVDEERPVGLLTRGRLLVKLARNFGRELYAKKPVTRIADLAPLVLLHDVPLATAVERALERDASAVYDEVIVVDGQGRYLGFSSVRELVREQGAALERTALEREAALARASDLEKVDRLRAQFLAHATHELRSPVNAIVALAELVRMACERGDLEHVRARLPMLLRAAATLRGTVNNILDLSKAEAGRMDVTVGPVNLAELVAEVAATARLLVGEKPVAVEVELPGAPSITSDAQKVRQILVNLVSNAAKFTARGAIRVTAVAEGEGGAAVSVRDTGCGIAEDDLPRLFVPFGQLEEAVTKSHEGPGLGLVITRSLTELLGGRVEVASRRGEGSTFTVHLPAAPPGSEP